MYIHMYISDMSQRYSIAEARSNLPSIVDQAQGGHQVELTRRGKPVAVVLSLQEFERLRGHRREFGEAYAAFLQKHGQGAATVDEDFTTSVRDRSPGRRVVL